MKRALLPALALVLTACSAGDDSLASDCEKISMVIHVPVTMDFTPQKFAAQLRAVQPQLSDKRLAKQVGLLAGGYEAEARQPPGTTFKPSTPEASPLVPADPLVDADAELTRLCAKSGKWRTTPRTS